jgi:hypothetical protein
LLSDYLIDASFYHRVAFLSNLLPPEPGGTRAKEVLSACNPGVPMIVVTATLHGLPAMEGEDVFTGRYSPLFVAVFHRGKEPLCLNTHLSRNAFRF